MKKTWIILGSILGLVLLIFLMYRSTYNSAISLQEIEAWQRLYGVRLTAWELDTIIELDAIFVGRASKKKG